MPSPSLNTPRTSPFQRRAFSLLELLTVMAIIGILAAAVVPAVGSLSGARGFGNAVSRFTQVLDEARAYAVSKRTYVYLGIGEFSAIAPETQGLPGTGRVALFTVASRDGTSLPTNAQAADFKANTQAISPLVRLNNVHLEAVSENSGNLQRPANSSVQALTSAGGSSTLNFPLSGTAQYTFTVCLEFSPQGMVRVLGASGLPGFIEIGLKNSKGDQLISSKNVAVAQLSGLTGKSTLYRP